MASQNLIAPLRPASDGPVANHDRVVIDGESQSLSTKSSGSSTSPSPPPPHPRHPISTSAPAVAAPSPVRPYTGSGQFRAAGSRLLKSDELHLPSGSSRLPRVMEHDEHAYMSGQGSSSSKSDEEAHGQPSYDYPPSLTQSYSDSNGTPIYTPTSSLTYSLPSGGGSILQSWGSYNSTRPRVGSGSGTGMERPLNVLDTTRAVDPRLPRPAPPLRAISSTYAPPRGPPRHPTSGRRMGSSLNTRKRDAVAQYRAQEGAYLNSIQKPQEWTDGRHYPEGGWDTATEDGTDDESPAAEMPGVEYQDDEAKIFIEEDAQPSDDDLRNPESRERLEWHSMLASVLQGDVVKQEKQRLIGTTEQKTKEEIALEIWYGARAKYYGRPLAMQKKMIEEIRSQLGSIIESISEFEIKGETVVGKTALEQVEEVVIKIEKCCWAYPSWSALEQAQPRAASETFKNSCSAVISWHNVTQMINTELSILQSWVGNADLDFTRPRAEGSSKDLTDKSSFIDRILKEDGLKSLQEEKKDKKKGEKSMFDAINKTIIKAKKTLIDNAKIFHARHLPPYIEELLTLINFPSRLVQEIIKVRLNYAVKMKDPVHQSPVLIDQMISQFQILMKLACTVKHEYMRIANQEEGWDLPPCIDENFDSTIVDALKFYFKMLNWKLANNKNTFREAEILEQEWGLSNEIGRQLDGGSIQVAEQFSSLTAKSLARLTTSFEKELKPRENENIADMEKRYKQILDSVRVRQRKMFRFSRLLRQKFENSTEYNLGMDSNQMYELMLVLADSGHFLVSSEVGTPRELHFIASHSLWNRPDEVKSILGTTFHAEDDSQNEFSPYILIINPGAPLMWEGHVMQMELRELQTNVPKGRLRLVANGSASRLESARMQFETAIDMNLEVVIEQRANLQRVNAELGKIKRTIFKLSNTIMESVQLVQSQAGHKASPELIQSCFAFATEFAKRSLPYMDHNRSMANNDKLAKLALDWVTFICDDCDAADRRTFKWAVSALEFAMAMTRGRKVLDMSEEEYARIRTKVGGCMSVLISHFDIMGARSTLAAQQERSRNEASGGTLRRMDLSKLRDDDECSKRREEQRMAAVEVCDSRKSDDASNVRANLGRVLEGSNEADRSLTFLSSSATNITMRWQQGRFVGGGTFGSVYEGINLDSGTLMAVKEIRLQDPQVTPTIVKQIGDEMGVLSVLDHPNIVQYYGIEVHRDKVYIFMEFCQGGSMASLLEYGRIEDETIIMVYALQMLEGLAYLHNANIVHRDIKPENILLNHDGVVKYVDFGAAKIIANQGKTIVQPDRDRTSDRANGGQTRAMQGTITGTPMYMSPEVIRGESAQRFSGAADIWSLGCVLLEMATGRRPWSTLDNEWAIMYNIASGNPPQLPTSDQLSEEGISFLKCCFDRDPRRRSTAAELLQHPWIVDIKRIAGMEEPETPTSSTSGGVTLPPTRQNSAPSIR